MARLFTSGFEVQSAAGEFSAAGAGGHLAIDTGTIKSGAAAGKSTVANQYSEYSIGTGSTARDYYARFYWRRSGATVDGTGVGAIVTSSGTRAWVRSYADGTIWIADSTGNLSSFATNANQWYRIEIHVNVAAGGGANSTLELAVDGVIVYTTVIANLGSSDPNRIRLGEDNTKTPGVTMYYDDAAFNDSTGTAQTSWPGVGKVVMLKPVSDNARVGWTGGALGTTNLWDAVNNTPPVGLADVSATNLSQIRDVAVNTTDTYDANLAAYTTAVGSGGGGLVASDCVNVVQTVVNFGPTAATACQLGQRMLSNPAISENVPAATPATAVGTYPTGWNTQFGTVTYAPAVVLSTQPVMRIRKGTSAASEDADLMGLLVEYVPSLGPARKRPSPASVPVAATGGTF